MNDVQHERMTMAGELPQQERRITATDRRGGTAVGIKSDHSILLNMLDAMASSPHYALRHRVLREAEALILHQEKRIKELEKQQGQKESNL